MNSTLVEDLVDPRICPTAPGEQRHYWYTSSGTRCMYCQITPEQVRDAFRDWRYEQVILLLIDALDRLAPRLP